MTSLIGILVLGFFLGIRHATDADHVIAISTIVTRQRGLARASLIGALWGIGHTVTIFAVGTAIILFQVTIPPRLGLSMEFAVGLMLILLGILNLTGALRWLHVRFGHGGVSPEMTADTPKPNLGLFNTLRPLLVGLVHGLAGSAAVAILVMATISNPWWALAYLLLFGLGTVAGMMAMTTAMALPFTWSGSGLFRWNRALTVGSGLLSVAFGMFISIQIGFAEGLFSANPHWIPR